LQVHHGCLEPQPGIVEAAYTLIQTRTDDAEQQAIEIVRIPEAIHVRFAETERAVSDDARVQARVVNADVGRRIAVDTHSGLLQQRFDSSLRRTHDPRRPRNAS
jgi:hypothetical protein